jgi:hypothetical protein
MIAVLTYHRNKLIDLMKNFYMALLKCMRFVASMKNVIF